jgi:hypothetical protein
MTTTATILDWTTAETIAAGLQPAARCDEAIIAARRIAADRDEPVLLDDSDGVWRVDPDGSATEGLLRDDGSFMLRAVIIEYDLSAHDDGYRIADWFVDGEQTLRRAERASTVADAERILRANYRGADDDGVEVTWTVDEAVY